MPDHRGIALIGPMCSGKSTAGLIAAGMLGAAFVDLDELWRSSSGELGYDDDRIRSIYAEHGYDAVRQYVQPFEVCLVDIAVRDHAGSVIAFGAGHAALDERPDDEQRVAAALLGWRVILVTPTDDATAALAVLDARITDSGVPAQLHDAAREMNREFVASASMRRLATHVLRTGDAAPVQIAMELVRLVQS